MDAKKALFRAKLREAAQKREKRIDSPLVRYNEYDQPICRVCNVTLKSESLWPAHQVSHKHHQAIENVKATATERSRVDGVKSDLPSDLQKPRSASALPSDFFDNHEAKRQKTDANKVASSSGSRPSIMLESVNKSEETRLETESVRTLDGPEIKQSDGTLPEGFFDKKERSETKPSSQLSQSSKMMDSSEVRQLKGVLPEGFFDGNEKGENKPSNQLSQTSRKPDGSEVKQVTGVLPEGFFDNKDADLRARGIEPVKVDINDAYKEFEKEIQDDLQEVDDRLEEEEIDAATVKEEFESLEQKQYRERVEMVKKQLMEVKAARLARGQKRPGFMGQESSDESSSDSDYEENFAVDWRAKHL